MLGTNDARLPAVGATPSAPRSAPCGANAAAARRRRRLATRSSCAAITRSGSRCLERAGASGFGSWSANARLEESSFASSRKSPPPLLGNERGVQAFRAARAARRLRPRAAGGARQRHRRRRLALRAARAGLISLDGVIPADEEIFLPDRVHLNFKGTKKLADYVADHLSKCKAARNALARKRRRRPACAREVLYDNAEML